MAQGRRLSKERCVDNPTYQEIRDVLSATGFVVGVENKLYSREQSKEPLYIGRIRVQLKKDDGTPFIDKFTTRESVMLHVADMIPKLKSRQAKPEQQQQQSSGKGKGKGKGRR